MKRKIHLTEQQVLFCLKNQKRIDEDNGTFVIFTDSVSRKPTASVVGGIETTLQIY